PDKVTEISKKFPQLNTGWLMTGEGEMLKNNAGPITPTTKSGIPYYDIENFACGNIAGFGQALEMGKESGYMSVPDIPARDGDMFIPAQGRSMIDAVHTDKSIPSGAWVCIRQWTANYIQWGEIYAIATHDGYAIKKLAPSERDGYIKCVSSNEGEGFAPYELSMANDIVGLAKVIGIVNAKVF
ncbi:MAG: S24 family peptidase, partial [Muribaculaceae bacterium]